MYLLFLSFFPDFFIFSSFFFFGFIPSAKHASRNFASNRYRVQIHGARKAEVGASGALFMILLTRKRVPLTSDARNPVPDRPRRI